MKSNRSRVLANMKSELARTGTVKTAGEKLEDKGYVWDGDAWSKDGVKFKKTDGSLLGGTRGEIDSKTWFMVRANENREFASTPEGKIRLREIWEKRKDDAKRKAKEIEVGMIEALAQPQNGVSPTAMMSQAIAVASMELSKRISVGAATMTSGELVLLSNTLMGLTKNLLSLRNGADEIEKRKLNLTVNNVNHVGKTGGAVSSILDVEPRSITQLIQEIPKGDEDERSESGA